MYLISADENYLIDVNTTIHQGMINDVTDYSAIQWGLITKHQSDNLWALNVADEDSRNPEQYMTQTDIDNLVEELPEGWYATEILE